MQYEIPKDRRRTAHPVVMVHGFSHIGKTYEDTQVADLILAWLDRHARAR